MSRARRNTSVSGRDYVLHIPKLKHFSYPLADDVRTFCARVAVEVNCVGDEDDRDKYLKTNEEALCRSCVRSYRASVD